MDGLQEDEILSPESPFIKVLKVDNGNDTIVFLFRGKFEKTFEEFGGSVFCRSEIVFSKVEIKIIEFKSLLIEIFFTKYGMFKAKFGTDHTPFQQSTSSVVDGDNFSSNNYDLENNRLIVCEGTEGKFYVQMLLKK